MSRVPAAARLGLAAFGLTLALGLGEVGTRGVTGGALPQLVGYTYADDGRIVLAEGIDAQVRRPDGGVWRARTGPHGMRARGPESAPVPGAGGGTLVVGDSQVFGSGVADDETFAARLGAHNAGVPGYGLIDALAQAEALVAALRPRTVLVVVDQANDWDDGAGRLDARYAVRGGWLLTRATAESSLGALWATPLGRSHLHYLVQVRLGAGTGEQGAARPAFLAPDPALTDAFAAHIRAFAAAHPDLRTVAVWLPVDAATSSARAPRSPFPLGDATPWADTPLRDALAAALSEVPLLDLLDALRDPAAFLDRDFHLSPAGHAAVAEAIARGLATPMAGGEPADAPGGPAAPSAAGAR